MTDPVLSTIRSRRVVRAMTDEPLDRSLLEAVLDAGRWAPTAGNRHLQRYVVTDDPPTLRVLRMVAPGMVQRPAAAVVICVDWDAVTAFGFPPGVVGPYVDVGTTTATMMLAAHAIGIGAGPVTSFSRAAVREILKLPKHWSAELIICLGHPADPQPAPIGPRRRLSWRDLTRWVPDR